MYFLLLKARKVISTSKGQTFFLQMTRTGLYNDVYACACVYQFDSLPTQQKKCYWRITIAVTDCLELKKLSFFLDWMPVILPLFFPPLHFPQLSLSLSLSAPFLNEMRRDGFLSAWATVALLSAWAVYRYSVSGWSPPVGLSLCCGDEMRKLWRLLSRGNKAWHPTDPTPLSSWYQFPQT